MNNQTKKPVKITETVLRDAHQSLIATKMKLEDMLPMLEKLDSIGYHSLEAWGGATFDACIRFLNEDPWERLRVIRSKVKNTKLQMLLRGQNLLGYKHYADDVVEYFVQKAIYNGIDIIRVFDALNDIRNVESAIKSCKKEGGHAQATVSYTISPVHDLNMFVSDAKRFIDIGADSICIKDMAGLLTPYAAYDLVSTIKSSVGNIPIQVHTHYTSGLASMTYLKAVEAGADIIDCALSPMAMGTSQPPTESIVATFRGTPYDTGYDLEKLSELSEYFRKLRNEYLQSGMMSTNVLGVDVNTLIYQVPGGMISNLISQLKESNALDKYEQVLNEIPKVRKDFGYPPLVTPTSQIVGTQAVLNVLSGERYKMVPKESKALIKGEYGKTPGDIPKEIQDKILKGEKPIRCRPADLIEPELDKIKNQLDPKYVEQDEDILSYAMFPQVAQKFFETRFEKKHQNSDSVKDVANESKTQENKSTEDMQYSSINKNLNLKGSSESYLSVGKSQEVAAVISAILEVISGQDGKMLEIKTFRRLPESLPIWNIVGRRRG